MKTKFNLLWWGRFDPYYARNGVLRDLMRKLDIEIHDFQPHLCGVADIEAALQRLPKADAVWVPCFRQRDMAAARRWCNRNNVTLIFDPLISAYDKQVFERFKIKADSSVAQTLLERERRIFNMADHVITDTACHAEFFQKTMGVPKDRCSTIYVGAEEDMFRSEPKSSPSNPLQILFYGSYIPLHGTQTIIAAARSYNGPPIRWCMLGSGPARAECEAAAAGLKNVRFEPHIPYNKLPQRIHQADILLGIFGKSAKAGRVMPNKLFQSLASGRPVITRSSLAYPKPLQSSQALNFIEPGNPHALADAVSNWATTPERLRDRGSEAGKIYQKHLSSTIIKEQIKEALSLGVRG